MFVDIGLEHRSIDRDRRVANRAAIAALAAIGLGMAGVVASAAGFRASDSAVVHALVTAPFPLAVVAAAVAYRARRELAALRRARAQGERRADEDPSRDPLAARVSPADLLAIERLLRIFYAAPSGPPGEQRWDELEALFARGALLDCGGAGEGDAVPAGEFVAAGRRSARDLRVTELERTVHVVDDVAVAMSTYEAVHASRASRGVNCLRMRRVEGGWRIEHVLCRAEDAFVTIRRALARPADRHPPRRP
ncbi:hypothetical protein [Anaeromyxobacter oryzae]|uniref:SnoaL-like domain-containing protein n=1 Tax=Anaeromyxobacter oryzae TaxID=2918170 RepID=A0ABN6MYP1_9BACT|nr:hypothetical protein [Anaeromyxobacter oryzae]BDG04800.1 hypothetical protein AMOR_37960 [Anaeromyxobacter oryzae]